MCRIMHTTGPAVWSDAVFFTLQRMYNMTLGEQPLINTRLENTFVQVGDVLLMPLRCFALGSGGYSLKPEHSAVS